MSFNNIINLKFERPEKELIDQFKEFPVANIDDAMGRTSALDQNIRPLNKTRLLGTAFTVKVAQGDNLFLHKAMDLAKPGDVIVIDSLATTNRAIFGELMASYCKLRGVSAMVTDGCVRDSDGIVVIKPEDAAEVIKKVKKINKKEEKILETMNTKGTYDRPWVDESLDKLGVKIID